MADITRQATASWQGSPKDGGGTLSAKSGEFKDLPFSFPSRFEQGSGTNPEELIGAAHAACFNMVIAKQIAERGHTLEDIDTRATVTLQEDGGGYRVSKIHLDAEADVSGVDESTFRQIAEAARDNCPISQLLKPGLDEVTMEARLS